MGLNELNEPFTDDENTNGLFFCLRNDIPRWLHLYDDFEHVCPISIPDGAQVMTFENKLKADKIYLHTPFPLMYFLEINYDPYYILEFDPFNLRYIENQNEYMCLLAIEKNPHALMYAKHLRYEHMVKACTANGLCLKYLKYQIEDACIAAVKQNGLALAIIRNQTETQCLLACQQNGLALQFVKHQTPEICFAAVSQNYNAIKYVKEQSAKICYAAWSVNKNTVQYFKPVYKKFFINLSRRRAKAFEKYLVL